MLNLRSAVRSGIALLFLVVVFAGNANAATFTLTNGPTTFFPAGSVSSVNFFNVQFNGTTGVLTLGSPSTVVGDMIYNLTNYNLTLLTTQTLQFNQVGPSTYQQDSSVFLTFGYGSGADKVEITNSTIDLTGTVPTLWTVPAAATCEITNFPNLCGGSTWAFLDGSGTRTAINLQDMQLTAVAEVPEPSSLYLMALGLGVIARVARKTR
jgi:hypothetical protein